jgi:hypothetical protein
MTIQQHASFDSSAAELNATSKLVKAWESKNAKNAAKAGGVSLMAVSLAACGGSSDVAVDLTPFAQSDIDAAVAAVDLTTDNAAAVVTALTTEAGVTHATVDAAVAAGIASVDITSDNAALIAAAVAAVDTTTDDATAVSLALRNAAADAGVTGTSTMTNAELITAIKTANDATIAAGVDLTTDNATAIDAAVVALGISGISTLAQLNTAYDLLVNPVAVDTTKTLTSATDNFTTTNGNDTFYALTDGNFATGDILNGGTGTDNLTAVFATAGASEALRPVMSGIETVDIDVTDGSSTATTTTLNLDQSTDVTSIRIGNNAFNTNADTFAVTNVGTAATLTVYDTAGHSSANANNYTMTYSGVTGTSDSATVNVQMTAADGALGTITIANVETVTANASGGYDATYGLTAADATTLTITAAADAATDSTGGTVTATAILATTLNVTSATDITINDNTNQLIKVSDVNIDSTVVDEVVTITGLTTTATSATADAVTIDITGAGDASVGVDTAFGTYNATTNADSVTVTGTGTGDITVTMNTSAANIVTTGSGNDTLIIGTGEVLNDVDNINLGSGTGDTIAATASYNTNAAIDLFHDDSVTTTDPTISGAEIARITLADSGAASTVATTSASWASTIELMGDLDDAGSTINNIGATQTVKLGSTLNMTDADSILTLVQEGATASAPAASLTITSDLLETSTDANIDDLRANVVTSVSLDLASTDTDVVSVTVDGASFDKATSVTVTSVENVTFGAIDAADDATLDFTGVTGTLSVSADTTNDYTIKGSASGVNTIIMSTGLDNDDSLVGGSATTDTATATVTGLTATTGAITSSGVEVFELTNTTTAVVDFTGTTDVTEVSINGAHATSDVATLKGLDAGTAVTLGNGSTAHVGSLTVALEDATGSSDSLTLNLTAAGTGGLTNLTTAGIETLNIVGAADMDVQNISVLNVDASKIVVTGGNTTSAVDLELTGGGTAGTASTVTLNAATTEVDASGYNGVISAIAATNTATTFSTAVAGSLMTGGAAADTFTVGSTAGYVTGDVAIINGNAGTDVLNVYVKNAADLDEITAVETINLYMDASDTDGFGLVGVTTSDGIDIASTVTLNGGLTGQLYSISGSITDTGAKVIDASNLVGSTSLLFADGGLVVANAADAVTITGGQSAIDVVELVLTADNTGTFTMSGVETLVAGNTSNTSTIDLTNVTGLTDITLHNSAGTGKDFIISALGASTTITLGDSGDEFLTQKVDINLADATGTSDALTVNLVDTDSTTTVATVDFDAIETLTLALANTAEGHNVALENNLTASTVVVTGTHVDADLILSSIEAGITTVNASGLAGELTIAATARGSDAMTITGGTGADTIEMENAADVLTGGAGTSISDEVQVTFSGTGGSIVVDLSSTTDQITLFNGVANSAAQNGFEDIDVSAYTQTGSNGADITGSTGANVIVGTGYADTIRAGEGADTITAGAGSDTIVLTETTAAIDTVVFDSLSGSDTITGFGAGDQLNVNALLNSGDVVFTASGGANIFQAFSGTGTATDDTIVLSTGSAALSATEAAALFAATSADDDDMVLAADDSVIMVRQDNSGTDYSDQIWHIDTVGTTVTATLLGTINDTLVIADFV